MTKVSVLTFDEPYRQMLIRLASVPDFDLHVAEHVWDPNDPDHREDKHWLDTNAPGWNWTCSRGQVETIELPIGANPIDDFLSVQVILEFALAVHREAWRSKCAAEIERHRQLAAKVAKCQSEVPTGVEVCHECAVPMLPHSEREVDRLGQFAFTSTREVQVCPNCGMTSAPFGTTFPLLDAMDVAKSFVGLPDYGSPLWSDAIGDEWKRRRAAPPLASVEVLPDMTSEAIIAELEAAMHAAGLRIPASPQLTVHKRQD